MFQIIILKYFFAVSQTPHGSDRQHFLPTMDFNNFFKIKVIFKFQVGIAGWVGPWRMIKGVFVFYFLCIFYEQLYFWDIVCINTAC